MRLSCVCGSGQRSLLPSSNLCSFLASLSRRSVLLRYLLSATSAPHGKSGSCLAAVRCSTGLSLLRTCLSPQAPPRSAPPIRSSLTTLAQIPQHLRNRWLPPPKPPFVHPTKDTQRLPIDENLKSNIFCLKIPPSPTDRKGKPFRAYASRSSPTGFSQNLHPRLRASGSGSIFRKNLDPALLSLGWSLSVDEGYLCSDYQPYRFMRRC